MYPFAAGKNENQNPFNVFLLKCKVFSFVNFLFTHVSEANFDEKINFPNDKN